jgi:hypothetical protein
MRLSVIFIRGIVPAMLISLLSSPPNVLSQTATEDHIVNSQSLQQQLENSSATRQQNVDTVTNFLSSPMAERAMKDAHVDPVQVRTAIPTLSDQELKDLAARASDAQEKFAAGGLGTTALLLIILGVVVIIIIAAIH